MKLQVTSPQLAVAEGDTPNLHKEWVAKSNNQMF